MRSMPGASRASTAPILGVPYTVKDTTWVAGRRVTNGSLLWKDFKPPRDAVAVER